MPGDLWLRGSRHDVDRGLASERPSLYAHAWVDAPRKGEKRQHAHDEPAAPGAASGSIGGVVTTDVERNTGVHVLDGQAVLQCCVNFGEGNVFTPAPPGAGNLFTEGKAKATCSQLHGSTRPRHSLPGSTRPRAA